jgi:hypothetical protein
MHPDVDEWSGRLSALAAFEPPVSGWQAVMAARANREVRRDLRWPAAMAAAGLVTMAGLGGWLQSARPAPGGAFAAAPLAGVPVAAETRAQNDRLESILAALPERHAMRGSTAFTLAELEDRLALLDDHLSRVVLEPNAPERSELLWQERVDVLHSLVEVRYAEAVGTY